MKKIIFLLLICLVSLIGYGQDAKAPDLTLPAESAIHTTGQISINGKTVKYGAEAGTQPIWNEEGHIIASLFYTYYTRSGIDDRSNRPLVISFNGGPGSASVWMHLAYTGPKILNIDDEGYPVQPYGVKDNPNSILDIADIVYVNPVNTGYSRVLDTEVDAKKMFFGVKADIKYLATWINTFITRKERWTSPKFLIGESYGTTRVSGLALELQNKQWMYLNGVILVSPTDIGIKRDGIVKEANRLPYFTAAAWYHKALDPKLQSKSLYEVLEESENYTLNTYLPALAKGTTLTDGEKNMVAEKVALYSGLTAATLLQNNLTIRTSFFWKDLLRDSGYTIGRLDSRYKGIDYRDAGTRPDFSAELTSWLHSFTPAINYYIRKFLKYETDIKYQMLGPVHPWDRTGNNSGENLRQAMAQNPYLNVLIQSGYFDGATNYFDAKYSMWHLDPSGKMKDRIHFKGYESGHMMYLRKVDLVKATDDVRDFINSSLVGNRAAKY